MPKFDYSNWVNWLLVIVGCLFVANVARTLFLSQLQAEEGVDLALRPALNPPPVPAVADPMPPGKVAEEEPLTGFERPPPPQQPPQKASPKRRASPARRAPPGGWASETDRLGM